MVSVLYISSWHSVLEYDDLNLLTELGFDWFSTGHYRNPTAVNEKFCLRPTINKTPNQDILNEYLQYNPININTLNTLDELVSLPINISKEFARHFDIVIINNWFKNLKNFRNYKDKCVIWRTYGNQTPNDESDAAPLVNNGLKIARMFDFETQIMLGNKEFGFLRNYVDSTAYNNWNGTNPALLTFQNQLGARINVIQASQRVFPEYIEYLAVQRELPTILYGLENGLDSCLGCVSWEQQKELYRNNLTYLALPAKPAPYTYNFLEALMVGIPTINFNKITENYNDPIYGHTYKVPKIIKHGENGFLVENTKDIKNCFQLLIKDPSLAKSISVASRKTAMGLFDKSIVLEEWRSFFKSLGFFNG